MLKKLKLFRDKRSEKVQEAREKFVSWQEISQSKGWKFYEEAIEKKMEVIANKIKDDTTLTGEELKRLQLAYQVYKNVQRIPKELKSNAGGK